MIKLCGLALVCSFAVLLISSLTSSGITSALKMAGLALVLGGTVVLLEGVLDKILAFGNMSGMSEYVSVMLRALGVAFLCRLCSDICRDCGQAGLAGALESAGKIFMVLLSLPIVEDIMEYALQLAG